jgi:CubicO group peptidase (beta-lactamase class C family)
MFGGVALEGRLHPDYYLVARALRRQLRSYPGGAAVCVYHRGECVVDLWGGVRDQDGNPWVHETMSPSFSTTKGVASTLLHILVDRGLLDYEDRVADHWPEFAQAGKERITVRQVMAHQSGLYHIRQMIDHADKMLDWEHMIRAIERTSPIHTPGERTGYHGLTYGFLVGEIIHRVTGKDLSDVVYQELAKPLGLDGLYVGAPKKALPRAAELIWPRRRFLGPGYVFPAITTPFGDTIYASAPVGAEARRLPARSEEHPRRTGPAGDQHVRLRGGKDASCRHPGRERSLHGALARAHVRGTQLRRGDRRGAAALRRDPRASD